MEESPRLLDFLQHKMQMTNYYQPLIIRELVARGGHASRDELALQLIVHDQDSMNRARYMLGRWPWRTLSKHKVVRKADRGREWQLTATYDEAEIPQILELCNRKLREWSRKNPNKIASMRYRLIEQARGRCQACGILSQAEQLDIDHIIPKSWARDGIVERPDGERIPVDDERNLQVLCSTCNRNKRDQGSFDFRPSESRILEALTSTLEVASDLGLDIDVVFTRARLRYEHGDEHYVPAPAVGTHNGQTAQ